jgi:hypothetical protein
MFVVRNREIKCKFWKKAKLQKQKNPIIVMDMDI